LQRLQNFFIEYAFFKKLAAENDAETLISCCRKMQIHKYKEGETIFKYGMFQCSLTVLGDIGTQFYVIVEGIVSL
jgi:CRP-like cAMP-binding protein